MDYLLLYSNYCSLLICSFSNRKHSIYILLMTMNVDVLLYSNSITLTLSSLHTVTIYMCIDNNQSLTKK